MDDERTDISIREDGGVLLASLVITDLTADDNGIYSCEANNSAGVDRMDKTLLPVLSDRVHPEKRSAEEEEEENSRKSPLCASDSLNTGMCMCMYVYVYVYVYVCVALFNGGVECEP